MRQGFTLIECMVVVALCATLLALTATNFSFMRAWLVRSDLDTLAAVCRYAQQCALVTHAQQVITFDLEHHCYQFNNRIYCLAPGVCFGIIPHAKGPPAHPSHTLTKPITFGQQQITCSEQGIINAGTIYLTDINNKVLYALSCAVSHTSYLRKYVYKNTWLPLS